MYKNALTAVALVAGCFMWTHSESAILDPVELVEPFTGIGIIKCTLPKAEGIAARWSFLKPCEGHLHPGATRPFGMVSAVAYSGGYPTGYAPDSVYNGITHFQQSGTGAIGTYYNHVLVFPVVGRRTFNQVKYTGSSERASPGYYGIKFIEPNVMAEVSVTSHCAIHRYTFGSTDTAHVIINLSHKYGTYVTAGKTATLVSDGRVLASANMGPMIYVAIEATNMHLQTDSCFAFLTLPPGANRSVEIKIGFSLRSTQQAFDNLRRELGGKDFAGIVKTTSAEWKTQLSRIKVSGGTDEQQRIFHTSLYHSLIKPIDLTSEHISGPATPYYSDFATLWDIYNTQLPLLYTFYPERGKGITQHLANKGPFCCSENLAGSVGFGNQGRVLSHRMIADAYLKGFSGIDYSTLKDKMKAQILAEKEFVGIGKVANAVHTLDLAYGAYCTAILAKGLGDSETYSMMKGLSGNWVNAYDTRTGVMNSASSYYEGGPWNYSFAVWHDMQRLIEFNKGNETFIAKLDAYFGFTDPAAFNVKKTFAGLNNQNDMLAPYVYLYVSRPDRTQTIIREAMKYRYARGMGGLAGNDDSGALSAWYVLAAIGLQPLLGQDVIWIGSPVFDSIEFTIGTVPFTIRTIENSNVNRFVQSATLDGEPLTRPYLTYQELRRGGILELTMGSQPSSWGRTVPPSWRSETTRAQNPVQYKVIDKQKSSMRIYGHRGQSMLKIDRQGTYAVTIYDLRGTRVAKLNGSGPLSYRLGLMPSGMLLTATSESTLTRQVEKTLSIQNP